MNEPQVWTLIGVFAASMVGVITLVLRTMNTQFASVNRQIDSVRDELKTEIASLRSETKTGIASLRSETKTEIASLRSETSARFEALGAQISHLDGDVQAISKRVFPG